ncbi:hypothetical protein EOT00_13640 [Listeria seeligeri]|nr:hypothetical protein [Listeria seeligeri]MBM5606349.1 hypothetical protein [Listeria seeligeri]MBM5611794.1 hypothetical protein [Listeria seeligeri]MBM5677814.1 hypothetical protein [Listeria seeligeri]MBM5694626.1 hypothetical protein [Listeria seeligeri]
MCKICEIIFSGNESRKTHYITKIRGIVGIKAFE